MRSPVRGLMFGAAALSLGILVSTYGPADRWVRLALVAFIIVACLVVETVRAQRGARAVSFFRTTLYIALFFALGWAAGTPKEHPDLPEGAIWVSGNIEQVWKETPDYCAYVVDDAHWRVGQDTGKIKGRCLLKSDKPVDCRIGDSIEAVTKIYRVENSGNPFDFDKKSYYSTHGIFYESSSIQYSSVQSKRANYSNFIGRLRGRLAERLEENLSRETAPLAVALLVGDRSGWTNEDRNELARSGLMHLFAISGLHVGFYLAFFLLLVRLLPFSRKAGLLTVILLLWFFVPLTGANPPVVRATVMATFFLLGTFLQRRNRSIYNLLLAYCFLLVWTPESIRTAGFQLSFLGAGGAILAAGRFRHVLRVGQNRQNAPFIRWIAKSLRGVVFAMIVSVGAFLATMPAIIWHFGRIAWGSPLGSLVAVPLVSTSLVTGWLFELTSWIPFVGNLFAASLEAQLRLLLYLVHWLDQSFLVQDPISVLMTIPALFVLLFAVLLLSQDLARRKPPILLAGLVVMVFFTGATVVGDGRWNVAFLYVGQGDGMLLTDGKHVVTVDSGPKKNRALARQLRVIGTSEIDLMILTHGDGDHIGAVPELLEAVHVREAYVGHSLRREGLGRKVLALLQEQGATIRFGQAGETLKIGTLEMRTLSPDSAIAGELDDNDASLVMDVSIKGHHVLFPGDISAGVEKMAVERDLLPTKCEVLVAPHHGSRTSSSREWLERLSPDQVVVSCGKRNRYGHPHGDVVERILDIGAQLYRTDREGAVLITLSDHGVAPCSKAAWLWSGR